MPKRIRLRQNTAQVRQETTLRRNAVSKFYALKMSQPEIVQALKEQGFKTSQPTVSRDIAAITEEWQKSTFSNIDSLKMRELQGLDRLELEAHAALSDIKKNGTKRELVAVMETILKISERRSKIIGFPEKYDVKSEHSGQIVVNLIRASCRKPDPAPEGDSVNV